MDLKAIVLDIDGTLLNSEKEISSRTKLALMNAQKKGMRLILASGRPTSAMWPYAKELSMEDYGGYLVSYNGAVVTACETKERLFEQAIDLETSRKILEHLKQFDLKVMINNDEYMFVNDVYDAYIHFENEKINIIEYEARGGHFKLCEQEDLAEFLSFPLNKILMAADPEYLKQSYKAIYAPFKEKVTGAFSAPFYFEFTDKGIDKAKALDEVFPSRGIKPENMIAFGDGENDRSMIAYAQIGVAMGNAEKELKAIADQVTDTNDRDGIALVLENYLENFLL